MPNDSLYLAKPSLAFAKLVATPTESSWSQVYNAGNLFACISLKNRPEDENSSLQTIGKTIFNNLEAEFFTLDEKNLINIKDAIQKSLEPITDSVTVSLCLAFFKDDILYLFIAGAGKVIMKREEKIGILLEKKDPEDNSITTASGFLQNEDIIVLETKQFADDLSDKTITEALELALPNDIAEALSPQIIEKDDGGQAAIIIAYHGVSKSTIEEEELTIEEEAEQEEAARHEILTPEPKGKKMPRLPLPGLPEFHFGSFKLTHSRKIFLTIVIIIIALLGTSIYFTKKQQQDAKTRKLYSSIYAPALKNYNLGKSLETLNSNESHNDFVKAEQTLKEGDGKFQPGSPEEQKISELKQKVEAELAGSTPANAITAKESSVQDQDLLAIEKANKNAISFAQDLQTVYILTDKVVTTVDKTTGKKKDIIKNNTDWKNAMGIAPYQGNLYILDQNKGILKYVAGADGYGKTSYFSSQVPDLSKSRDLAIDSSVYVLYRDGSVLKFTRGQADDFTLTGLNKPFANPTKIFTDNQTDSLYVLDNGNSSIIKLSKTGAFQSAYASADLGQAKDFEVLEQDKKALFLSNDKIWEIPL